MHGEVFSPLSQLVALVGLEEAMLSLVTDPGRAHACLSALAEGAVAQGRGLAAAGADAVLVFSAYAGATFLSRRHYEDFVLVYSHTCGAIGDRLDLMAATGTQGIDTLDPPPLAAPENVLALREARDAYDEEARR